MELGQGLARLGSQTHLIVRGDRVLGQEESDVSEVLAEALKEDGIELDDRGFIKIDYQFHIILRNS